MKVPTTPQEVIDFIGSNYCTRNRYDSERDLLPAEDFEYCLSVHDLLSAFSEAKDENV